MADLCEGHTAEGRGRGHAHGSVHADPGDSHDLGAVHVGGQPRHHVATTRRAGSAITCRGSRTGGCSASSSCGTRATPSTSALRRLRGGGGEELHAHVSRPGRDHAARSPGGWGTTPRTVAVRQRADEDRARSSSWARPCRRGRPRRNGDPHHRRPGAGDPAHRHGPRPGRAADPEGRRPARSWRCSASTGGLFAKYELEWLLWGAWRHTLSSDRIQTLLAQFYADGGTLFDVQAEVIEAIIDSGLYGRRTERRARRPRRWTLRGRGRPPNRGTSSPTSRPMPMTRASRRPSSAGRRSPSSSPSSRPTAAARPASSTPWPGPWPISSSAAGRSGRAPRVDRLMRDLLGREPGTLPGEAPPEAPEPASSRRPRAWRTWPRG